LILNNQVFNVISASFGIFLFIKSIVVFRRTVKTEKTTGSKELRADPLSSQLNAGNVKLVKGDWNKAFIEEFRKFPRGKHDDIVDATSLAFNAANQPIKKPARFYSC
jgi:phage terminase large subunit-like protein